MNESIEFVYVPIKF